MRPLSLSLEGFTSYRQRAEVDFRDLDLFAITGPTGAGKSSLMDAITYALYGQVPRLGSEVKEFINQGSERLRVTLEFAVDGQRYRVMRSTARKGQAQVQLEWFDEAKQDWEPQADRVSEVNERVRRLLGLDFQGFTRSVLLPQGRFAEFLSGEPQQRRKVLGELLRLDVYEEVRQRAGELAREAEKDADRLERQLAEQYADATPQELRRRQEGLRDLGRRSESLRQERALAEAARTAAEALAHTLAQEQQVAQSRATAQERLAGAEKTLRDGEAVLEALDKEIAQLKREGENSSYDPALERRLELARSPLAALEGMETELAGKRQWAEEHGKGLKVLADKAEQARKALADAEEEAAERARALEAERQQNAAMYLRRSLQPGEACPVCGQAVATVPPAKHVALDAAAQSWEEARRKLDGARKLEQEAGKALALAHQQGESLHEQVASLDAQRKHWHSQLLQLGVPEGTTSGSIEAGLAAQAEARKALEACQKRMAEKEGERETRKAEYDKAAGEVTGLRLIVQEKEAACGQARQAAQAAGTLLLDKLAPWPEVRAAAAAGRDIAPELRSRVAALDGELQALSEEIGRRKADLERIRQGIVVARRLRDEVTGQRQKAAVARTLADLLRADRFVRWLIKAVMRALARNGSQHLQEVSSGRYEFAVEGVEGHEFLVIDHWNADEARSVRTLSGGETFLASLALALALAESLPGLSSGRPSSALESIFLDEGFGNLDDETLDVVAAALEGVMSQRRRMVGVITHLRPLAERLPARINIVKTEADSRLYVD